MKIWIDGDACPRAIKDILFRVAERTETTVTLVANQWMQLPDSIFIHLVQAGEGPDVADDEIVKLCEPGDLVITADIPLADRIVEKDAFALNPRGHMYNQNNIKQALSSRNFMDTLRGSGVETGGPNSFSKKDSLLFANALDKFIAQQL